MKKKKKVDIIETHSLVLNGQDIRILVSEEDKTGCDIMAMSDFFTIALREMSKELTASGTFLSFNELPLADISVLNEAIHAVGVFSSPEFELIPDFSSLPKDIQEKYRTGKLILGESKQVDGNVRAVLVDADTKVRVKDVTFKKVEKTDVTNEIFQNILTQMQLRQISDKQSCPKGMCYIGIEYECSKDISLQFCSKDFLKSAPITHVGSSSFLMMSLKPDKELGTHNLPLKGCVIQTAVPPDTSKIPAELFLYFEKVAEWEEKA